MNNFNNGQRLASPTPADTAQAENLSKLDMRRSAGGTTARKKGEDCGPALWYCLDQNQPFGSDLIFNCWASCWAMSTNSRSCAPARVPISPICSSTSRAPLRLDNSFSSPLSLSWRREISFRAAETRKAAMLSPSFLSASIPSITSCGIRMFLSCDFVFTLPVAIIPPEKSLVCEQYTIKCVFKMPDINTYFNLKSIHTLSTDREQVRHKNSDTPEHLEPLPRRLTTNDSIIIEVAMRNHTTAQQRFTFLFLAVVRAHPQAHPHREQITAVSEREARSLLAGRYVLVFAGCLPALEVTHG